MNNQFKEVGYAISSRDFLVLVDGFPTIKINDMVQSESGARGWVNGLMDDSIEVLMLDQSKIKPNQAFKRLPDRLGVTVGNFLLGRAINPLGVPIDGKGPLHKTKASIKTLEIDQPAPGIDSREFITRQFITGITLVDTLIPLACGQRELVLGDAHSGKTQFLIDIIVNQKKTKVICVYACVGKPAVGVRNLIDQLRANGALNYTVIVAALSSEPAPLIFLTPKTAFTISEYFQRQGQDVLLILDDLGTHAKVHREIALLSGRPPGKESYPGDTFYQQAHLMERAGNFNSKAGGGSITALPVAELTLSDFTTLIPTNLMSMTDGHLLFRSNLFARGQRPSIDIGLSVSRVGRQTQTPISNLLSSRIRHLLSTALDLETISRFSAELPSETQLMLRRRDLIMEFLKQEALTAIPRQIQAILLALPFTTFMQDKNQFFVEKYKNKLIDAFLRNSKLSQITRSLEGLKSDEQLIKQLEEVREDLDKIL